MALIVEDGTGLGTASSYLSVANADTYHSTHGSTGWASATTGDKENALRRATQYLDARYTWLGVQTYPSVQALQWPRTNLPAESYYIGLWPTVRLQQACAELALRSLTTDLYTDQPDAQVKSKKVGPIEIVYERGQNGGQVRYSVVDDLLKPLLSGGGRMFARLERAS